MWLLRFPHRLRARVVIATVAMAVAVPAPVAADPAPPDGASEAVSRLAELSHQAEELTEQWHNARADLDARRSESAIAVAAASAAADAAARSRADQTEFRGRVDRFIAASLRGAAAYELAAVLGSESPGDLLDRMETLDLVAADNDAALRALRAAVQDAQVAERAARDAHERAASAQRAAERLTAEIERRRRDMDTQIVVMRDELARLTPQDRESYVGGGQTDFVLTGPVGGGVAVDAMRRALTQQGKPYLWLRRARPPTTARACCTGHTASSGWHCHDRAGTRRPSAALCRASRSAPATSSRSTGRSVTSASTSAKAGWCTRRRAVTSSRCRPSTGVT